MSSVQGLGLVLQFLDAGLGLGLNGLYLLLQRLDAFTLFSQQNGLDRCQQMGTAFFEKRALFREH